MLCQTYFTYTKRLFVGESRCRIAALTLLSEIISSPSLSAELTANENHLVLLATLQIIYREKEIMHQSVCTGGASLA